MLWAPVVACETSAPPTTPRGTSRSSPGLTTFTVRVYADARADRPTAHPCRPGGAPAPHGRLHRRLLPLAATAPRPPGGARGPARRGTRRRAARGRGRRRPRGLRDPVLHLEHAARRPHLDPQRSLPDGGGARHRRRGGPVPGRPLVVPRARLRRDGVADRRRQPPRAGLLRQDGRRPRGLGELLHRVSGRGGLDLEQPAASLVVDLQGRVPYAEALLHPAGELASARVAVVV